MAKLEEKKWEIKLEKELFDKWTKEKLYAFDMNSGKEIFAVDHPPVYPSGEWHIGAVAAYTLIDMAARVQRMKGKEVLFPFSLDRNGINMELVVEKKLKKLLHEFEREEFIELCRKEIDVYSKDIVELAKTIGMSAEFNDPELYYETDSPEYRKITQQSFIEMWNKGLVYEDFRPNNYCPKCKTVIAEAEVLYENLPSTLTHVKWKIKETNEEIIIATSRPELLCACQVVLFHPDDEKYKHLEGKHAILPLYDRKIPIKPHHIVKPEFGSGILMVCSYGDIMDVQIFRELSLEPIIAIDIEGKMTKEAGPYANMIIEDARKKIREDLKKAGLVEKEEKGVRRTPICERSKTPIEIISLKEWYFKQLDYLEKVYEMADKMKFYPKKNKQILLDWVEGLTIDWPISRRRYYHTEIPLWYCKKCNKPLVPKPGKYYQPWKDPAPFDKCPKCEGTEFRGEERVFDTWVDSSITNMYICGYGRNEELFKKSYPCALRPQGRDIVRTWLYYTTLRNYHLEEKPAFKYVMIHGMGLDPKGKKMSKSKGNIIHPKKTLDKFGAEAFRFWAASEVNVGDDFRISEERIGGSAKFLTKFWNTAKFISGFERVENGKLKDTDRWILAELNNLVKECTKGYGEFNFFIPANKIREFIWNVFAPHYIEMIKNRAYENDSGTIYTLHTVLKTISTLLAPVCPFITDKIYQEVYGKSVHKEEFPKINKEWENDLTKLTEKLITFNSSIWKQKKDKGISLKAEISIKIPDELKPFEEDLRKMHKLV